MDIQREWMKIHTLTKKDINFQVKIQGFQESKSNRETS